MLAGGQLSEPELTILLATCSEKAADRVRARVAIAERRLLITLISAATVLMSWDLWLWVHGR
jgi:hypothetical protein